MPGRVISALLMIALTGLCSSCRTATDSNLVGTYRAEATCVKASLVLNKDHSFLQDLTMESGETKQIVGRWSLDVSVRGGKTLVGQMIARYSRSVTFRPYLNVRLDGRLEQLAFGSLGVDIFGPMTHMGPMIGKCGDSSYKIDYVK